MMLDKEDAKNYITDWIDNPDMDTLDKVIRSYMIFNSKNDLEISDMPAIMREYVEFTTGVKPTGNAQEKTNIVENEINDTNVSKINRIEDFENNGDDGSLNLEVSSKRKSNMIYIPIMISTVSIFPAIMLAKMFDVNVKLLTSAILLVTVLYIIYNSYMMLKEDGLIDKNVNKNKDIMTEIEKDEDILI